MRHYVLTLLLFLSAFYQSGLAYSKEKELIPDDIFIKHQLFDKYPVEVYKGKIHLPKKYKRQNNRWIDDMGKTVTPVEINFAGRYYIGLHSCGAGCRYYSLINLADQRDFSDILDVFVSNPDSSKKGLTVLLYEKNSRLLVARNYKNIDDEDFEQCLFLLKDNKLKNINQCSIKLK